MWTLPCPGSTPYGRDVPTSRAEAAPTIGRRARLVTAELLGWFAVSFAALSSFYLPLSVVPTSVVEQGASPVVAGWVMTTLLGSAVVAEILTPRMLRLCAARCLAAIGLAFMAVASAAVALTPTMATVVALSGLQGFGFGLLAVVVAAELGALLPHDRRGEGLGMAGLVACVPAVTGLPAGLWLADSSARPGRASPQQGPRSSESQSWRRSRPGGPNRAHRHPTACWQCSTPGGGTTRSRSSPSPPVLGC